MGLGVLSEIGTLIWSHSYVSCSLLLFLTPPFFPILKYFSPLLISTALFVVALVTLGPHFEEPGFDQEADFLVPSEVKAGEEGASRESGERDVKPTKKPGKDIRSTWSDWVQSYKASWLTWVEQKLQNENWKIRAALNDENVSILQEAFAHKAEAKPRVMSKLLTRRIPDDDEERVAEDRALEKPQDIPVLSNSDSWKSDRGYDRAPSFSAATTTRDLPHNFFSPHPSFKLRHDSDSSLFENVMPPPIEYDMPPLITGPASITTPLLKSIQGGMYSDDDDEQHHGDHDIEDHMHLEVGEVEERSSLDAEFISQNEVPMANGFHDPPPAPTAQLEDLASSSENDEGRSAAAEIVHQATGTTELSLLSTHDEVQDRDIDVNDQQPADVIKILEETAPPAAITVPGEVLPSAEITAEIFPEERQVPAIEVHHESQPPPTAAQATESPHPNDVEAELHDIPDLEDVLPVQDESRELPDAVSESVVPLSQGDLVLDREITRPDDAPASDHGKPDAPEAPIDRAIDNEKPEGPAALNEPEVVAALADVSVEAPRIVERLVSVPVHWSLEDTHSLESAPSHEDLPPVDESLGHSSGTNLSCAISLPVALHPTHPVILQPKTTDQGALSPDTGLESADHGRHGYMSIVDVEDEIELAVHKPMKQLSNQEKLLKIEVLSSSISAAGTTEVETRPRSAEVVKAQKATTEEQVTHVTEKMKSFVEDSPSKKFQTDAPQLQITPPSIKVVLTPSPSINSSTASPALGRPPVRPLSSSKSFTLRYSSDESSEDEQIELNSDVDAEGTDSESDSEIPIPVKSGMSTPKLPEVHIN